MIFWSNLSLIVGLVKSYVIFHSKLGFLHKFCILDSKYPFSTKSQHVFLSCFYIFIILRLLHMMSHIVTIVAIYHRDDSYEIICVTNSILKRKNLNVPRVVSWVNPLFDAALFSPVITNPQLSRWYLRPDYRIDFTFMTRR